MRAPPPSVLLWAKLGHHTWPECYHPLICHLIDVAQVTRALWNLAFRKRLKQWVTQQLGLPTEADTGTWLAFWAGAHDIGKACPGFQFRDAQTVKLTEQLGIAFNSAVGGSPHHGETGTVILRTELARIHGNTLANKIAVAVGGHHGLFFNTDALGDCLGDPVSWGAARVDTLNELKRLLKVDGLPKPTLPRDDDQSVWMFVAGLTSAADWVGSNATYFEPFFGPAKPAADVDIDAYWARSAEQAEKALRELGWLDRGEANGMVVSFAEATGIAAPRPLQEAIEKIAANDAEPQLIVVEAPMGEGKTEAAWYVADCWDRRHGQGTYVALPTMATSNQMFQRVGEFLKRGEGKKNLMLQHGKALLNAQFDKLKFQAHIYDENRNPSAVVAEGWFASNKKHNLLAPFGVGTIDQVLLAVLQTKHVFVRLFGLAGKCVILDEVHAYDAYMTTLLERLLTWLSALRCPVVLLSATLPQERRKALIKAYCGDVERSGNEAMYPRVTVGKPKADYREQHVKADESRARTVLLGWLKNEDLVEKLREALKEGGCAAVIRNTVGLAQQTFLELRDTLKEDGIQVDLFHARFPFGRRQQIENDVLERFGKKGGPAQRDKRVLVATQVVEQSLDIDFDLMISDLAPVDLVLQRAGRLWRHKRETRLGRVVGEEDAAPLWLLEPSEKDGVPDFGISGNIYSRYILFRSLLALRIGDNSQRTSIRLPTEIDPLVELVYSDEPPAGMENDFQREFLKAALEKHEEQRRKEENEAECRQIKKPSFRGVLARIVGDPREEDSPDLHPAHQALTRLTQPTAQLICLVQDNAGGLRLPHDGTVVPGLIVRPMRDGGVQDITRLMLAEVSSAHWGLLRALRENCRPPSEWADVSMLCRHFLIRFINGRASVGDYTLELNHLLGLSVTRQSSTGEDE